MKAIVGQTALEIVQSTGVDVIVLGCAGMEGMEEAVMRGVENIGRKIQVVDCVQAAVELMMETLRADASPSNGIHPPPPDARSLISTHDTHLANLSH